MSHVVATINGAKSPMPTVLGQRAIRISTGGKIRAGIKVLTRAAASHPRAKAIYDQGVTLRQVLRADRARDRRGAAGTQGAAGAEERAVVHRAPGRLPQPADRPPDPGRPSARTGATGCGGSTAFPVVFPADQWQSVMPHELVAWGANERRFWSEYSPDGRVRHCKCHAPVPKDATGKRAIRRVRRAQDRAPRARTAACASRRPAGNTRCASATSPAGSSSSSPASGRSMRSSLPPTASTR
ncbi:MAG: hypothetical protein MZW92_81875 [Comamonadaceae bacterium]|nr:hypothetical protein [Comamonadaceae bacterium]